MDYKDLDLSELSGENFIGTPQEDNYQRLVTSFLNDIGVQADINIEVPDLHLASDLALEHVGAIITPEPICQPTSIN